jgi:hypothetical protein
MSTNAKVILDELLEKRCAEIAPHRTPAQYFEIFSAEQILKEYDLSHEEIEDGLVGGGGMAAGDRRVSMRGRGR